MQIRHLSLRNIRSYERAELDLPPGTTLIAGDVGAGKTSLLYAVEMALFGFAAVDAPFLIRHGAVHAEVSVTLEGDGHRYEVGRRFRRVTRKGRDSFEIERLTFAQDGARTLYSATELRQRVIDLFGFPDNPNPRSHSDLWRWAVYVPQERMREVLSQEPQERLETVRRALGVERYRLAADNAQEAASEIRQLARFRREESDRLAHWESELVERSDELERLEVRSAELEASGRAAEAGLAEERATLDRADAELRSAEGDRREQDGLEREQAQDVEHARTIERTLIAADSELAGGGSLEEDVLPRLDRTIAEFEAALHRLEAERQETQRARTETETHVRDLLQARTGATALERALAEKAQERSTAVEDLRRAEAEADRARIEGLAREPPEPTPRALPAIEAALAEARTEERAAIDQEVRARAEVEEIDQLLAAGECPRCHQPVRPSDFGRHREEAARVSERTQERARERSEAVVKLDEERRSRERFERARERWLEAERRRDGAQEQARSMAARLQAADAAWALAGEQVRAAQAGVTALSPAMEVEAHELATLARIEADAHETRRRLEESRRERERAHERQLRRERLVAERGRAAKDLEAVRGRMGEREGLITQLSTRTSRIPEIGDHARKARLHEQEARQRVDELRLERARVDQDAVNVRRRRHEAESGVHERGTLLQEVLTLEAKAAWLGGPFREALLAMEQRILSQAQATFQRDFSRFFRSLIDDPLLEARVGAGFDPTVLIHGEWTPAEALSGGERTALALAFRLALGRVVRSMGSLKLNTLILDEPTDGFSPEQIIRMGELLRSLALPQLVLVSHESQLSAVADQVAETVKQNGRSEIHVVGRPEPEAAAPPPIETGPAPRRGRARSASPKSRSEG